SRALPASRRRRSVRLTVSGLAGRSSAMLSGVRGPVASARRTRYARLAPATTAGGATLRANALAGVAAGAGGERRPKGAGGRARLFDFVQVNAMAVASVTF